MTNKKISALTAATTPLTGSEVVPLVQSSATDSSTVDNLTAGRAVNAASLTTTGATKTGTDFQFSSNVGYGFKSQDGTRVIEVYNSATYQYVDQIMSGANVRIGTAAKGINFTSNTPAAGMTSQLLNWYEEGTWTPTQGGGLTVVGAFTSLGKYTRIGRQVTVQAKLSGATSIAATSGEICGGLPFTSNYATIEYSVGSATNAEHNISSICMTYANSIYGGVAISATAAIYLTVTYFI